MPTEIRELTKRGPSKKEQKKASPGEAILFSGLPGIGLVGKIAVDYLIKKLSPEKSAEIFSDSFYPSVVTDQGLIEPVKDTLYHAKIKGKDLFILAGDAQPKLDFNGLNTTLHYEFALKLVEYLKKAGIKEIYSLAGIEIGDKRIKGKPGVVVAATSKPILEGFKKLGARVSQEKGLITGSAGLLLGIGKANGIEGACLMGETSSRIVYSDSESAKEVLELLNKRFNLNIDLSDLGKEADKVAEAFKDIEKDFKEQETLEEQDSQPDHGKLTYIR